MKNAWNTKKHLIKLTTKTLPGDWMTTQSASHLKQANQNYYHYYYYYYPWLIDILSLAKM